MRRFRICIHDRKLWPSHAVSARGGSEHGLPPPGGGPAWRVVRGKLRHPKVTADACRGLGVDSGDSRAGHKLGLSVGDPYREGAGHCGTTLASSRAGEVGCQVEPLVRSHVHVHTRHDPLHSPEAGGFERSPPRDSVCGWSHAARCQETAVTCDLACGRRRPIHSSTTVRVGTSVYRRVVSRCHTSHSATFSFRTGMLPRVSERPICGREGGQQGARTSNLDRPSLWEVGTTPADMAGGVGPAGEALGGSGERKT